MAFFSGIPASDFGPLFRLLDDYDTHRSNTASTTRGTGPRHASTIRSFAPKFDVREQKDAYELIGELPGIEQKDISIEFTDSTTLVVKGRVERSDSFGTKSDADDHHYHKPSAEDEESEQNKQSSSKEVSKKDEGAKKPEYKYWVAERSVGEFHRSFTFPNRVDTDNVKASLKNGILTITVSKAPEPQTKKITIQ
jgi:HSP20 family molecular chaperone IbpA